MNGTRIEAMSMFHSMKSGLLALPLLLLCGCGAADPSPNIRARFDQLTTHVCSQNVDACLPLVDPAYLRTQGEGKVKLQLGILTGLFKLGNVRQSDIRIDDIVVAEDGKSAQVQFSLQTKGEWKSQNPSKWVLSEGQWYLAF